MIDINSLKQILIIKPHRMKRIFVTVGIVITLLAFAPKNKLVGRWETKPSPKGNITGVVFNKDYTYEGYVNKKPFVSGTYSLGRNSITIEETGCNGVKAVYKLIFSATLIRCDLKQSMTAAQKEKKECKERY
jgi:hypothetical protein